MEKPLRVLTISKPYVAAAYREKMRIWAHDQKLEVGLIVPEVWGNQTFESCDKDDYWIKQLPIRFNGKNHFHYYKRLEAAITEFKPDVINCEEEHYSLVTYQVFRIAHKRKIKTLFYTWQNIFKRYPFPFSYIEAKIFKQAAAGAAGNQEASDILRAKGFAKDIKVIPQMGVNILDFYPDDANKSDGRWLREKLNLPSDAFVIVYMGRMVEEKGLMDLVDACEQIPKGCNVYVLFLGDGPFQAEIQKSVETKRLNYRFRFLPFVGSLEVPKYMRACNLLCLPSLTRKNWKEQFGRVLVEAMASGCVPVGSSSGEIPRVIGNAGLVFDEGDSIGLRDAILSLYGDRERLEELKAEGLKKARTLYSQEAIASQFSKLFFEV